jgi:parallel beta-helix repeat protein
MKPCLAVFLIVTLLAGLVIVDVANFGAVQAASNVSGIITTDTTWTKAGSPYTLTGNTLINHGVTLTIEEGATVDFNSYELMVNGTLIARGASGDEIHFNGGELELTPFSTPWDEATGTGSIIDYCISSSTLLCSWDTKISNSYIDARVCVSGNYSIITGNTITQGVAISTYSSGNITNNIILGALPVSGESIRTDNGNPVITHNTIQNGIFIGAPAGDRRVSATVSYNTINGDVSIADYSVISYNTITGDVLLSGESMLTSNIISGEVSVIGRNVTILENTISGGDAGVTLPDAVMYSNTQVTITGNTIFDCGTGIYVGENFYIRGSEVWGSNNATITDNLIYNCTYGIHTKSNTTAEKNTVIYNTYGIKGGLLQYNLIAYNTCGVLGGTKSNYNSIYGNSQYNMDLGSPGGGMMGGYVVSDLDATNNWWGTTTDASAINQTFYDYYSDFILGKVIYVPFLTAPDPQTPTSTTIPSFTPIPTLSPSPTASPTQTSTSPGTTTPGVTSATPNFFGLPVSWVIAVVVVVAVIAVLAVVLLRRKPKTTIIQPLTFLG